MAMPHSVLYCCRRTAFILIRLFHFNIASLLVALTFPTLPTLGDSQEATNIPLQVANLTQRAANISLDGQNDKNSTGGIYGKNGGHPINVRRTGPEDPGVPREFPTALVIASSVAAVCILVFFIASYVWHTRQLDSRARKLAIRLAADAEHGMRCANCTPPARKLPRPITRSYTRAVSESSQDPNICEALTTEDDNDQDQDQDQDQDHDHDQPVMTTGSEGGRSSIVVSESDTADLDDIFETPDLSSQAARGARLGSRTGRGAHRKWSRSSRKSSGAPSLDGKRDSAVTDKEILSHFANRRHSTFFI